MNIGEEINPAFNVEGGKVDINDIAVRDTINMYLDGVTCSCFLTPYIALERISKVLAPFHIFLPRNIFLEGGDGVVKYPVEQFGSKIGMTDDGKVVTSTETPYILWYEWAQNPYGKFDIFCSIVDASEASELDKQRNSELNESTTGQLETGPRRKPGANPGSESTIDMSDSERERVYNASDEIRDIVQAVIKRSMKPGIKFGGTEAGSSEKSKSTLFEKKLLEYVVGKELDAAGITKDKRMSYDYVKGILGDKVTKNDIGSAKTNLALRDYARSKGKDTPTPSPSPAPAPAPAPAPSTRSISKGPELASASTKPAPAPAPEPAPKTDSNQSKRMATVYSPQDGKGVKGANVKMQGGTLDAKGNKIGTVADYVTGKSDAVTVAVDRKSPNFGKTGKLDASKGINFTRHDASYPGDPASGTKPGEVKSTIYGQVPVKATDTGSAFKGKGETRVDIPVQANRPDSEGARQPLSKQNVNISFKKDDNTKVANLDEDETIMNKNASTQQPTQSDRTSGINKLKQAFSDQEKASQERIGATVDRLKMQDLANKAVGAPPKAGQHDI